MESLCATTVDGVVRVCVSTHSSASLCVDLVKAFQKTWPCCRNGHRFNRPALKVLSGGERQRGTARDSEWWSTMVCETCGTDINSLLLNITAYFITSA